MQRRQKGIVPPDRVRHHTDGGLVEQAPEEDEPVGEENEAELPPMYADVPKSGPREG
jgi:hypothetical protein